MTILTRRNWIFAIDMKSASSTSAVKDDDIMEATKKPGTSGEFRNDKGCRGQKRKNEDNDDGATSSKKVE